MFRHYVTMALRNLGRSPLTALINVATLALGLVAFVTAYAVVGYWDSSERQFANADRTYVITASMALRDGSIATGRQPRTTAFYERYLRVDFPEFEKIARANAWSSTSSITADGKGARVASVAVDPEFLEIFDLPFVAGDRATALQSPDGIVLTEQAALRLFGTRDVLGKTVTLGANLIDATVTGVLGPIAEPSHIGSSASATLRFDLMVPYDLYERLAALVNEPPRNAAPPPNPAARPTTSDSATETPRASDAPARTDASRAASGAPAAAAPATAPPPDNWLGGYCCTTYAMLKKDSAMTAAQLNLRLLDFGKRHVPEQQQTFASVDIGAVPVSGLMVALLNGQLLGPAGKALSITSLLFGLGSLVLLVACVNYANLATARAVRRAREVGLRKVIGARRAQVVWQSLFEAALLTGAALAIAIGIVELVAPLVRNAVGIDMQLSLFATARFWVFVAALLAAVTALGGAYPALVLSRVRPIEALRLGRTRLGPRFASTLLVGAQFAAASFLLIAVIVMYTQNAELRRTGLGAAQDQYLVIANFPRVTRVENETLRAELARIPQVKGITFTASPPWSDNVNLAAFVHSPEQKESVRVSFQNGVGYDFFTTLDIPLVAGRSFDREHNDVAPRGRGDANSPPLNMVIDRELSRELGFATPEAAVDQILYLPSTLGGAGQQINVIGVVESRSLYLRGLGATSNAYILQDGAGLQNAIVRLAKEDVGAGVAAVEQAWRGLAPQIPLQRRFMDELFNESYQTFARINTVFAGLAGFAFFISVIGLFGMAIQVAGRRTHEIGVRKSVGAHQSQIVAMLLRDFSKPVVIANVIAWPLAYFAANAYLSVFIQRISLTPLPFVLSLAIVVLIAWAAVGSQALRAARANPATVLRFE